MTSLEQDRTIEKAELIKIIIELQRRFAYTMHGDDPEHWLALNLTIAQLKSLFFINYEGSTNSKMLAKALQVTPPNVTGIVDRLVEQGLVNREENPENRRMQLLTVTDKGVTLLRDLDKRIINPFSRILAQLKTEDLSALARGLTALVEAAECNKESQYYEHDRS
jgi:MarR family transcriptional regulator, organic hydroperoxide resistance regulator